MRSARKAWIVYLFYKTFAWLGEKRLQLRAKSIIILYVE